MCDCYTRLIAQNWFDYYLYYFHIDKDVKIFDLYFALNHCDLN